MRLQSFVCGVRCMMTSADLGRTLSMLLACATTPFPKGDCHLRSSIEGEVQLNPRRGDDKFPLGNNGTP